MRNGATALRVTLDGVPIKRIKRRFYTESTMFKVVLPADNLFGLPEGFTLHPSVSAGYNVMLAPLRPGRHTLHIAGSLPESSVDVTYHLR